MTTPLAATGIAGRRRGVPLSLPAAPPPPPLSPASSDGWSAWVRPRYHFAGYLNRLRMPQPGAPGALSPFYYSFDYGPVHFLVYVGLSPL